MFTYTNAPANCDGIALSVWDNNHVSEDLVDPQPFTPTASLYDGSATYVLKRGVKLSGTVLGPDGSPLGGATVARGNSPRQYYVFPPQTTDANGHFSFHYSPGQGVFLTIQAKGCAPQLKRLTMGTDPQDVTISMQKGHRISGKVVDGDGRPVRNAQLSVQSWQDTQVLNANFQTDDTGSFHWNDVPADPVMVNIFVPGSRQGDNQTLTPDQDNVIKLAKTGHIRGTVVDAETGKPIQSFKLTMGIQWPGQDRVVWQGGGWDPGWQIRPGSFEIESSWNYPGVAIRAQAMGYLPADSRVVRQGEDATLELKMKPGKDVTFTVLDADGNPVTGAQAVLAGPGQQAQINNGQAMNYSSAIQATSGADGKIDLPPEAGAFRIAVVADAGYAQFSSDELAKSDQVRLAHWGTIKGKLMIGSKPGVNEFVDMNTMMEMNGPYNQDEPRIYNGVSVKTDGDGNFEADRVSPGKWSVGRRVMLSTYSSSTVSLATADVAAGQTVTLKIGGDGRPVVGKVIYPTQLEGHATSQYDNSQVSSRNNMGFEAPPMPLLVRMGSAETQQKWFREWMKTDEGKKYLQAMQDRQRNMRSFPLVIGSDGTFRVEDVPPGSYSININLNTLVTGPNGNTVQPVGTGYAEFTMPAIEAGKIDEPLQVDPVEVTPLGKYKVGDAVADLKLRTSDGKDVKLSDFRGKYLLVDFPGPMDRTGSPIQAVGGEYGQDSRLAFLTINPQMFGQGQTPSKLSKNPGPDAVVAGNNVGWMVINRNFGSGVWLIGPDGKVVAEELSGDGIRAAVFGALGAAQIPATQPAVQATSEPAMTAP